jgi:solute carrier family 25 (mitochondrial carrier protein), member 16
VLLSHASETATSNKPRQMDDVAKKRRSDPVLCPTDEDAIAPKRKAPEKRSFDYVWRSGLAGGLAGCAVCQDTSQT